MLLPLASVGCVPEPTFVGKIDTRSFRNISMSCKDTPKTRQQIDEHNSVLDTLKSGKAVVYKNDCDKPKAPTS